MLIIVTSADIDHSLKNLRNQEYEKTISWLKNNVSGDNISWIETVKEEDFFIEKYIPVFYSKSHAPNYRNKGSNWGKAIEKFLNYFDINEKYVCHLTGRYHFSDNYFFETIQKNPEYDLYVKNDGNNQYMTGCFSMKTDYFIKWITETDWDYLNSMMLNLEKSLWDFSRKNKLKVFEFDSLHMEWNIFGNGNTNKITV